MQKMRKKIQKIVILLIVAFLANTVSATSALAVNSIDTDLLVNANASQVSDSVLGDESAALEVTVDEVWVGGPEEKPTIELQLYQNGQAYGGPVELVDGQTEYTWTDLPETDEFDQAYVYTVDEVKVPEGYEKDVDGLKITNTFVIEKTDDNEGADIGQANLGLSLEQKYKFVDYWMLDNRNNNIPMLILAEKINGEWVRRENGEGLPNGLLAYCFDIEKDYPSNEQGKNMYFPLDDIDNHFYKGKANQLRSVLLNGFPQKNVYELELESGVKGLTPLMALRATQFAIWHYTNGFDLFTWMTHTVKLNRQEVALFKYLIGLKPTEISLSDLESDIELYNQGASIDENGNLILSISYKATKDNHDGTLIYPSVELDEQTLSKYPDATIVQNDEDRILTITIPSSNYDLNSTADIEIGLKFNFDQSIEDLFIIPSANRKIQNLGAVTIKTLSLERHERIKFDIPEEPEKTEVTVDKVWVGGPDEKPTIEVQLYRNGEAYGDPVTLADGELSYTWTNLDKTDSNGVDYTYTVDEVNVPEGYEKDVDGLKITNTFVIEKTEVTVNKEWVGGPEVKPTIEVQLYRNGEAYGDPVTLADGELSYTWTNLDKTDEFGKAYVYTVDEVNVPEGYEKDVDGLKITNTFVIEKTEVTVNKEWVGGPEVKPTIEVQLYRNGEAYGDPVTLADGELSYTWTNLDKTDEFGKAYVYTVDEVNVPEGYEKDVDGLKITNTFVVEKTEVTVDKVWVGGPDEKPTIEVQLYRNGEAYGDPVTLADGELSYTWTNLDKTDEFGKVYVYTVDEVKVPEGYEKDVDGFTITNTKQEISPTRIDISGYKTWEDNNNKEGRRPNQIIIRLYADGIEVDKKIVTESNGWKWTFENLDMDNKGKEIKYTISEDKVEGYTSKVDGYNVTNKIVPKIIYDLQKQIPKTGIMRTINYIPLFGLALFLLLARKIEKKKKADR